VGPQASGYPDRGRDQGRRRHPAQHHQAPGAGVAACEHRSPKAWNCPQAGEECRASVADGDPRRPGASLTPGSGRSAGVMLAGHNERPHLRFSRISIARCADPDPLPRVCLGLSRHLQSTPSKRAHATGQGPPRAGPLAAALAGRRAGCGRRNRRPGSQRFCRGSDVPGRALRKGPAHRDASRLGEPVQLVGIRLANLPENRRRWDQIPPLPAQELAYPPPSAASAHMPARRSGRPTGR
jgi:hypothetical protein